MIDRVLLIDADMLVFSVAIVEQQEIEWQPDQWSYSCDLNVCKQRVDAKIANWKERLKADKVVLCFSDPDHNFRKEVLPSYKSNRKGTKKPMGYLGLVGYCMETYPSKRWSGLEGDDVLGILHTTKKKGRQSIVLSGDKDLRTVPGLHVGMADPDLAIEKVTITQANLMWMSQVLTGDAVDGYKGCPSVGPVGAAKALAGCRSLAAMWAKVVETYDAKGLTEKDALVQARVARILRKGDIFMASKRVKLWKPARRRSAVKA